MTFVNIHKSKDNINNFIGLLEQICDHENLIYEFNGFPKLTNDLFTKSDKLLCENNKPLNTFINLFLSNIIKHEKNLSGISKYIIPIFIKLMSKDLDYKSKFKIKNQILNKSILFDENKFNEFLSYNIDNFEIQKLLMHSFKIVGVTGKIRVDFTARNKSFVKYQKGYEFNVNMPHNFSNIKEIKKYDVKVLVINGIIEKCSEIDHILNASKINSESVILVAMGYGDEVLATLKMNYKFKRLDIIPLAINCNEENLNILKDISVVCNTRYVSADRGDILSTIKYNELNNIEEILITDNKITIKNDKNIDNVKLHLENLRNKCDETNSRAASLLIQDRIKSLSSEYVTLYLNSDTQAQQIIRIEKIHNFLSSISYNLHFGYFESKKIKEINKIFHFKEEITPTFIFLKAFSIADELSGVFKNIDCVVSQDII